MRRQTRSTEGRAGTLAPEVLIIGSDYPYVRALLRELAQSQELPPTIRVEEDEAKPGYAVVGS